MTSTFYAINIFKIHMCPCMEFINSHPLSIYELDPLIGEGIFKEI